MMILGDLGDNGDDQDDPGDIGDNGDNVDDPGDIGESVYTCKKEDAEDTDRTYAPSNNLQKTPPCSVVCFVRYL